MTDKQQNHKVELPDWFDSTDWDSLLRDVSVSNPEPTPVQVPMQVQKPKPAPRPRQTPAPRPRPKPEQNPEQKSIGRVSYSPAKQRRVHRFGFYKVLLVIVLVMIAAICAGTVIFWRYIEAYEASRHEHVIESLRENIDYDFWTGSVESALVSRLTVFEAGGAVPIEPHLSKIRDVQYTFRQKNDESTPESPIYIVRAGARDIGIVRLSPAGNAGFNFNLWEVGSIELLDSFVDALAGNVSVTVSQNARVEVNGLPVTDNFRIESDYDHGATYLIQGIFGDVEVSVFEFDGRASDPYFAENGEFIYPIIIPFTRSFNILVPKGADVFVDGEIVSTENITAFDIVPGIFEGVVETSNVPLTLLRYEFEQGGFYLEPAVTSADKGVDLLPIISEGGEILFAAHFSAELKAQHEDTVAGFIRAYVNFGTNIGNNVDANYSNVSGRMLRGTELFRRTQSAVDTMRWVSGATIQYNSLEIDNFRQYGDSYFSCEVRYNITNRTNFEVREVEGNFEVLFVLSGGRWLAAKMVVI